jgi:hypothetical protein
MIAKADSTSDAVLMTLAGIAYGAPKDIGRYIEEAEPTASDWQLDWLPSVTDTPPNFAFAAHNTSDGTRVVSIRGTYPNPLSSAYWEDGRQDSPFGTMVSWPGNPEAKISAGTATGFENLKMLANGNGITLQAYLATVPDESPVFVTGHSLGGTLAPVLALWFTDLFPGKSIFSCNLCRSHTRKQQLCRAFWPRHGTVRTCPPGLQHVGHSPLRVGQRLCHS